MGKKESTQRPESRISIKKEVIVDHMKLAKAIYEVYEKETSGKIDDDEPQYYILEAVLKEFLRVYQCQGYSFQFISVWLQELILARANQRRPQIFHAFTRVK